MLLFNFSVYSFLILLLLLLKTPAVFAEDEVTTITLDTVVVTSRKREEILQKTPETITVFTSQQIEDSDITSIEDISLLTPGFTYSTVRDNSTGSSIGNPVIRGQNTLIGESNVGIFIDGVYQNSRHAMESLFAEEIERIEVVKGPQNALYGRNTFAGAINYITKKPSNLNSGKLKLTGANRGRRNAHFFISGPIQEDTIFLRLSGKHSRFDGFYENELTHEKLDDRESNVYSLSLSVEPHSNLDLSFRISMENTRNGDSPLQFIENNAGFSSNALAPPAPFIFNDMQYFSGTLPSSQNGFAFSTGFHNRDNLTSSLQLNVDFEQFKFTSITGYNNLKIDSSTDNDYSARMISATNSNEDQDEFSQEFRLSSTSTEQSIHWVIGSYFYNLNKNNGSKSYFLPNAKLGPLAHILFPSIQSSRNESTENWAAFGSIGFDIIDNLTMTLSGRYAYEKKTVNVIDNNLITLDKGLFSDNITFKNFTPKAILSYQLNSRAMIYGSIAKAIKSGGFNTSSIGGRIPSDSERSYDEETSINYELGLKSTWLDNRLTANLSTYYIKWDDQVVRTLGVNKAVLNSNAGTASSKGFELELTGKLSNKLDFTTGLAYTNATHEKYTLEVLEQLNLDPVLDGNPIQYVSDWTANATIRYIEPISFAGLRWKTNLNVMYQSEQAVSFIDDSPIIPDRTIVNLRTGIENESYSIVFWVKNLFNNDVTNSTVLSSNPAESADYLLTNSGLQQFQTLIQSPPKRNIGVTISLKY